MEKFTKPELLNFLCDEGVAGKADDIIANSPNHEGKDLGTGY